MIFVSAMPPIRPLAAHRPPRCVDCASVCSQPMECDDRDHAVRLMAMSYSAETGLQLLWVFFSPTSFILYSAGLTLPGQQEVSQCL